MRRALTTVHVAVRGGDEWCAGAAQPRALACAGLGHTLFTPAISAKTEMSGRERGVRWGGGGG